MPKITGLLAWPVVQEWSFHVNEKGARGIRVYQEDITPPTPPPPALETLPSIGDPWDSDFANCRVIDINVQYFKDDDNCPRKFTLTYETSWLDSQAKINDGQSVITGVDTLAKLEPLIVSIESSSELITVDPPEVDTNNTGFRWSDGPPVVNAKVAIGLIVNTKTFKLRQMIKDITAFEQTSIGLTNRVNRTLFMGCKPETLLYRGYSSTPWRSETDEAKWECILTFEHRIVTGNTTDGMDGWNYIVNENRASTTAAWWQKPYRMESGFVVYQYLLGTFDPLLYAGVETTDLLTNSVIPTD